jgi:hypothetical protein
LFGASESVFVRFLNVNIPKGTKIWSYLFMGWQLLIICLIACSLGPSYRKNMRLGLTSSKNEALFVGVTLDPLFNADFVSASDI